MMARKSRDELARQMFRAQGFEVKSVSLGRQRENGEFMELVFWPGHEAWVAVELLTQKANNAVHISRIHIGRETYPGQPQVVRVYVAWDSVPEPR